MPGDHRCVFYYLVAAGAVQLEKILIDRQLTIGIVGAGGFAAFAAMAFLKVEGIRIKAVTDIDSSTGFQLANKINARFYPHFPELLEDPDIDLIYIATPPYLHYVQSRQALEAGKHVICEKPAALKTSEARELAAYARSRSLLYAVNLMQRYNPLYATVKMIIEGKWLGDFLHGFFENYASDEKLVEAHWFWDVEKSGGIFIEHGVHFFDMFDGWLGAGQVVHAMELFRESGDEKVIDRVQATVLYPAGPVTFYHGFNQPRVLDRQELRLQFDRGDITLYEWVPVKIRLHGLFTADQMENIKKLLPGAAVDMHQDSTGHPQLVRGKFREISYDVRATITSGNISDKMDRYEQLIIAMIKDQWAWIKNPSHVRVIDDSNAIESLRMAEQATGKASHF